MGDFQHCIDRILAEEGGQSNQALLQSPEDLRVLRGFLWSRIQDVSFKYIEFSLKISLMSVNG